jgi:hypothetical protein
MTDLTNLHCPICRVRISTWARLASNNHQLVNEKRWQQIREAFPKEIKHKLGQQLTPLRHKNNRSILESSATTHSSSDNAGVVEVKVAKPGEIRKEYLENLKRMREELKLEKEKEEKESIAYIEKLIVSF